MIRFEPRIIFFTPVLLLLIAVVACGAAATDTPQATTAAAAATTGPTAMSESTQAPVAKPTAVPAAMVTSTTKRLVVSTGPMSTHSNLPWAYAIAGRDKGQIFENLVGLDRYTGKEIPQLATKWEMSPDGMDWTFWLREGVQFHNGWGEFTARDVVHMVEMLTQDGAVGDDTFTYRSTVDNVEIIDDYQVVFHQTKPESFSLMFFNSGKHGTSVVMSKAQWDAEGEAGYLDHMIGTGPYKYVDRKLGVSVLMERVEDHWRLAPEFEEIELFFISEQATRLASILAGEAHIVVLAPDLADTAVADGMIRISSDLPGGQYLYMFGGQYYSTPENVGTDPWVGLNDNARKVRQAMNKAINRQELIDQYHFGDATMSRVWAFHSLLPGYNPDWDATWEEEYGFDLARAKELLVEAGYPNGFKAKVIVIESASVPQQVQVGEAIALYWKDLGLDVEQVQMESSKFSQAFRTSSMQGFLFPISANFRDPQITIRFYNDPVESVVHSYETDFMHENFLKLASAIGAEERSRWMRAIGDKKYEDFAEIPLFWFPAVVVVNPDVVAEYAFPGGTRREYYSHLEYVVAAEHK